jgi:hypothetical protein
MLYSVRYLWFNDRHTAVIVQAVNGPCPLLAIANVLLLRAHIQLPPQAQHVSFEQLIDLLKVYIMHGSTTHIAHGPFLIIIPGMSCMTWPLLVIPSIGLCDEKDGTAMSEGEEW